MKLSVSNIAWNPEEESDLLTLFGQHPVSGIEIAPTKLWPGWRGANREHALQVREQLGRRSFNVPALQAILFDQPGLKVFADDATRASLLQHLELVADLAQGLGAHALVFGSPKNRDRGDLSYNEAFLSAAALFTDAAKVCAQRGVQLCIEPNPGFYQCNFLTRWEEVRDMVEHVAHPGLGIHLDTACIALEGGDVVEAVKACGKHICHFHVSEKNLADFSAPEIDHASIGRALHTSGYDGWISIEMRRSDDPRASLVQAIRFAARHYLGIQT